MQPWWERYPNRLTEELDALKRAGYPHEITRQDGVTGALELRVQYPFNGGMVNLTAKFPPEYPYFPVAVAGADYFLDRHQHPVSNDLCLLGNPTQDWSVRDTLANLLANQLPDVLQSAHKLLGEEAETVETRQGEPWSDYPIYPYGNEIVVGGLSIPASASHGKLIWAIETINPLRGIILEMQDHKGQVIARTEPQWVQYASALQKGHGEWQRINDNPPVDDPLRHFSLVNQPFVKQHQRAQINKDLAHLAVTIFPEEAQWRTQADGWLISGYVQLQKIHRSSYVWARAARGGLADIQARIPELKALSDKRVMLVGLGMLGSSAALHLARSGIRELYLVDYDYVELGTTVRWGLGKTASGYGKGEALSRYIQQNYPYTTTSFIPYRLGQPADPQVSQFRERFEQYLERADLILDMAAEFCVSNYLRRRCLELNKFHVWATATPGNWGGMVGRFLPRKTGCWSCMNYYMNENKIPTPNTKNEGGVQPAGCRSPTSTGAGFDSDEVVLSAVRLTASTLCTGISDAYPTTTWDIGVLNLRSESGELLQPGWWTGNLQHHPDCDHD